MRLLLALLALLITTDANATRYWASSGGSNSAVCTDIDGTADPTPNYGSFARAVACATASGDEVYVKAGTYTTNATITNPTSGITIRGELATKASWPVLQPTGTAVKGVAFTSARSNVTFKYLKWDLSNATTGTSCFDGTSSAATTNIVIEDFECLGPPAGQAVDTGAAIGPSSSANGWRISRGKISRWSTADHQPGAHCLYWAGHNSIMEHIECTDYDGHGIQFYVLPTNNVIRNSYFHGATHRDGIYFGSQSNKNTAHNNIVADYTTTGITMHGTANEALHNTIYEASAVPGITISGCATGSACLIANNIIQVGGTAISGTDPDVTITTNRTTAGCMIDPANGNFSLSDSSACINAGTQISTVGTWSGSTGRFVGTQPDQGALESCVRNKSVVENDEPTHYHTAYDCPIQSSRNNVTLQTPTVGNWAIVVAGVSKTLGNGGLVSATISGQSTVEVVLASAVTNGQSLTDAMTRSAAPSLMDSVSIGDPNGTVNVSHFNAYVRTHAAASGTNNVGAAPAHVVVQSRYQFFKLRGAANTVVTQCATCAENVPITLPPGAAFRLRVKFRSDDTVGSVYNLRYSKNAGAYTLTPDAMGADFISWHGVTADTDIVAAGTATTEILTSDEASNTACAVIRTSSDYPSIALNNSETECEYVLKISTSAPVGTTYDFRIYDGSGSAIDTYTNTPRLTVGSYTMMES